MTLLLCSFVCDYCDGIVRTGEAFRGFVVWPRGKELLEQAHVFPTRKEAESWVGFVGHVGVDVREIRLQEEPRWQDSKVTARGISLVDTL